MRIVLALAALLCLHAAVAADGGSPFPLQIETRVPVAPTVFPSGGTRFAVYELYLTNFSGAPEVVQRIEVLNADDVASTVVASIAGEKLDEVLQGVGAQLPKDHQLNAGATAIAYMWIPFESEVRVPGRLRHRVVTANSSVEGAVVSTHGTELRSLAPPVRGTGWMASDGPSNDVKNHHRRGVLVIDGHLADSRRFAVDWMLQKNGESASGDAHNVHSYHAYEQPLYAVGDATVVTAHDGQPDNVPNWGDAFRPAVPITMQTVGGNHITLDLGGGQYAWYFHLRPGSVRVKVGEHVRRGQVLGNIGCSGDARVPHLHFEVTTSAVLLAGEGLPYLIDHFRVWNEDKSWETRSQELPLDGMLVDFGPADLNSGL